MIGIASEWEYSYIDIEICRDWMNLKVEIWTSLKVAPSITFSSEVQKDDKTIYYSQMFCLPYVKMGHWDKGLIVRQHTQTGICILIHFIILVSKTSCVKHLLPSETISDESNIGIEL